MSSDHTRPPLKHPRGHCWQVLTHSDDPMRAIERLETPEQCRQWLGKLNELDADAAKKEAVADRLRELLD